MAKAKSHGNGKLEDTLATMLQTLADTVGEKIGFKASSSPAREG